ncbi:hypothetical protein C8F04DRAFT_949403 [Mycena alexandri]|uniref:SWIM-type domain-containing protein n=1 Tax=Mycena alexandri TaxID=1745969 RepID=A0AAD6T8W2_9AGAR|nr:hypothetical protein C8F04DRAFT_949403 [Mycena alexandri]
MSPSTFPISTPVSSVLTTPLSERAYSDYVDSVLEDGTAFLQISQDLFVVNGWDLKAQRSKDTWYHIRSLIGSELVVVCTCPSSNPDGVLCVHEYLLRENGAEFITHDISDTEEVILFTRQVDFDNDDNFLNHFSCPSPNKRGLSGRVIVTYDGCDDGRGRWRCEKDSTHICGHIGICRTRFQQLVNSADYVGQDGALVAPEFDAKSSGSDLSVSYHRRPPPVWAALPTDPIFPPNPFADDNSLPGEILLAEDSSCCCTKERYFYRPTDRNAIKRRTATIYRLFKPHTTMLELQSCLCKRRFIGPECGYLGIFNYNNKVLFTHEILDEYTSAFTTSETPFSAWALVVSRRYGQRGAAFCSVDIFRAAWFSYVRLLHLEADMVCPKCGPCPENTIWDGVTLAFNRKHLLPSLEPPTVSQETSLIRQSTVYVPSQQILSDSATRRLIRKVITGPALILGDGLDKNVVPTAEMDAEEEEDGGNQQSTSSSSSRQHILERLESIPLAVARISGTNPPLSRFFDLHFGNSAVVTRKVPPDAYKRFFFQISADESVLQTVNMSALEVLEKFVKSPTRLNASALVGIPVLHDILMLELGDLHQLPAEKGDILEVCLWLAQRGRTVFAWLKKDGAVPKTITSPEKSWTEVASDFSLLILQTGCCYGMPKIRERPVYPRLKHDTRPDPGGKRGAKCSKYYSQYGEKRLTGGIMCVWCTHSICYGFHCIPKGEGRNDVFSALITRWERPPKRVIYDFACALGPYCMTREPEFFAETQFLIDDFHAVGHSKCAPAAFLKTYCAVDPRLRHINSSAGECGNSGISRIRKSVSYMAQDRAIVYTKVFLSIWNRQRIRSL